MLDRIALYLLLAQIMRNTGDQHSAVFGDDWAERKQIRGTILFQCSVQRYFLFNGLPDICWRESFKHLKQRSADQVARFIDTDDGSTGGIPQHELTCRVTDKTRIA